jgi:hypothetical protein
MTRRHLSRLDDLRLFVFMSRTTEENLFGGLCHLSRPRIGPFRHASRPDVLALEQSEHFAGARLDVA